MANASSVSETHALAEQLQMRPLRAVEWKQQMLYACRHLPPALQKPLRKWLWRQQLRHMRYVVPEVGFHSLAGGSWELCLRGHSSQKIVSTPLAMLRKSASRPSVIIATGPSAQSYAWSDLADGRSLIWAVNGAPTMLAKHGLRCDFLVVSDYRFGREGADHITLAVDQGATLLLTHEAAAGFATARPDVLAKTQFHIFEKVDRWYGLPTLGATTLVAANEASGSPYFLPALPVPGVGWSQDPLMGVFAGKTVSFAALQLAVWAGSEHIEIVGMDLGGMGHAYHEDKPTVSYLDMDYRQFILPSFECMAAALAGSPVQILNLSPTCPLPKELFHWNGRVS